MFDLLCICLMVYTLDLKHDPENEVDTETLDTEKDPEPCEWGYFVDFE